MGAVEEGMQIVALTENYAKNRVRQKQMIQFGHP